MRWIFPSIFITSLIVQTTSALANLCQVAIRERQLIEAISKNESLQLKNAGLLYAIGLVFKDGEFVALDQLLGSRDREIAICTGGNPLLSGFLSGSESFIDKKRAIVYFENASRHGHIHADIQLGTMYWRGQGIPVNFRKSEHYFLQAARRGNVKAQNGLAALYAGSDGQSAGISLGVTPDYIRAYVWANIAARNADADAISWKNYLKGKLTPRDVSYANRLSNDCFDSNYRNCTPNTFDKILNMFR